MLLELYIISDVQSKGDLEDRVREYLDNCFDIAIFLKAIELNIIIPNKDNLKKFSSDLSETQNENKYYLIKYAISSRNDFEEILECIKSVNDFYMFLIERENYDYKKYSFNTKWLYYLTAEQLQNFEGEIYEFVRNEMKRQISTNNFRDKELIKFYFEYFDKK